MLTNLEKLQAVINTLDAIQVPAGLTETVSVPIYNCILALKQVHQSVTGEIKKQEEAKQAETEEVDTGEDK